MPAALACGERVLRVAGSLSVRTSVPPWRSVSSSEGIGLAVLGPGCDCGTRLAGAIEVWPGLLLEPLVLQRRLDGGARRHAVDPAPQVRECGQVHLLRRCPRRH